MDRERVLTGRQAVLDRRHVTVVVIGVGQLVALRIDGRGRFEIFRGARRGPVLAIGAIKAVG